MSDHRRWGSGIFLLAAAMLPAGLLTAYHYPSSAYPGLYQSGIPILTVLFALTAAAGIAAAYPRIQHLHLLIPGGLSVLNALYLTLLGLFEINLAAHLLTAWSSLVAQLLLIPALLLPAFLKPRLSRLLAGILFALFLLLSLLPLGLPSIAALIRRLEAASPLAMLGFSMALLTAVSALSLLKLRQEFSLGGLVAGIAFLLGINWISALRPGARDIALLFSLATPFLAGVGTLLHWLRRMEHRALYDPLLQIYNRGYCESILSERSAVSLDPPLAIALFDLDHFKKINDTYGHQAGDAVLFQTAQTIQRELIPAGIVCRYGGEEIIVFFPGRSGREVLADLERTRKRVETLKVVHAGREIKVTLSCGAASRNNRTNTLAETLKQADAALYRAKSKGRNRIELGEQSSRSTATPKKRPKRTK